MALLLHAQVTDLVTLDITSPVAALAIDKVGPRPYHFRSGPNSGPTTRPREAKNVKLKSPLKLSTCSFT